MSKELRSLTDYGKAAVEIVDDLLKQDYDEGQISDLCDFIKQELKIRDHVRIWDRDKK